MKSLDNTEPSALCFQSNNDAVRYASHRVEDANRWLSLNRLNISERYEKSDVTIEVELRSTLDYTKYHLVFLCIPCAIGHEDCNSAASVKRLIDIHATRDDGYRSNDLMFVGVTNLVQGPEKVIPSLVWLKRCHQGSKVAPIF